jgi:hypothetical protein
MRESSGKSEVKRREDSGGASDGNLPLSFRLRRSPASLLVLDKARKRVLCCVQACRGEGM